MKRAAAKAWLKIHSDVEENRIGGHICHCSDLRKMRTHRARHHHTWRHRFESLFEQIGLTT